LAGAEIEHVYPMSIPVHGQALNITVNGYVDGLDFGLMAACERWCPTSSDCDDAHHDSTSSSALRFGRLSTIGAE